MFLRITVNGKSKEISTKKQWEISSWSSNSGRALGNREDSQTVNSYLETISAHPKMNAYLKEIGDLCSIKKRLTFHMARHTFATTVTLTNGVAFETVSKMLGYKSLKQTQHYAKIVDLKISEDMNVLRSKS